MVTHLLHTPLNIIPTINESVQAHDISILGILEDQPEQVTCPLKYIPICAGNMCDTYVYAAYTSRRFTTLAIVFTHGLLVLLTGTVASFPIEKEHHNMI